MILEVLADARQIVQRLDAGAAQPVGAHGSRRRIVVDPATEQAIAEVAMASATDVDAAVAAARRAFETWSGTSPRERIELLDRVIDRYDAAAEDLATAMTAEMGSPLAFSRTAQFGSGRAHLRTAAAILEDFRFEERDDGVLLTKLPIGVCALITPWNWPMNQLLVKVAPALAAGCTVVVKPSEFSPLSSLRLAEAIREAGLPVGVFNLVNGDAEAVRLSPPIRMSIWFPSRARMLRASPSLGPPPARSSGCTKNSAASRRSSSLMMPIWKRRSAPASRAAL